MCRSAWNVTSGMSMLSAKSAHAADWGLGDNDQRESERTTSDCNTSIRCHDDSP
jgi:hypothetical protein